MRCAVLDTNVIVSALISPKGNAAVILGMITDNLLKPIYCQQILREYVDVLTRPRFGFPETRVKESLTLFEMFGVPVDPRKSDFLMIDESDRIFYDAAVASAAVLITGNLKHYPREPFVVSPADFLFCV
ncbi:MAG: putative toxin-antitoxin system toxin component, PIN family [Clostridiales bacterium]|jgi:putative PIN family toxin of toxin-antitoxin system|nr:putative toxin-antitoxin system toxin component, PIN family [Clostridiales bacterium]